MNSEEFFKPTPTLKNMSMRQTGKHIGVICWVRGWKRSDVKQFNKGLEVYKVSLN